MLDILNNLEIPDQSEITEKQQAQIKKETGFDIISFNEVVELQNKLNERVDPNWKSAKQDWNLAMLVEGVELIDSIDWPWWKTIKTDWHNIEVEMLDEFHFLLAKSIEDKQVPFISNIFMAKEVSSKENEKVQKDKKLSDEICNIIKTKFIPSIQINNTLGAFLAWTEVWYLLGNNADDLFRKYKMKYTLNQFRQDNGYKIGEYSKIWFGEEDNVHVQKLAADLPIDKDFIDKLYKKIKLFYETLPKKVDKSLTDFINTDEKWSKFIVQIPEDNRKIIFEFAKEFKTYLEK